ncbi:MAG: hypothetical protein J5897_02730 [Candidatus Methanomethylophilus sp.]|nr:hypothetical protein [Methanomethylophilus sp.]
MWGSHSFNSIGARLRAAVGKVRGTVSSNDVDYDDDEYETERFPAIATDYEEHSVPAVTGEPAKILVRKQSSVVYFEEDEEAAPIVVSNARDRPVAEEPVNQVEKKPRIAVTEPADLFINALRKPARERFATAEPVIRRKEAAPVVAEQEVVDPAPAVKVKAEVPAPVIEIAEPDISQTRITDCEPITVGESPAPDMTVEEIAEPAAEAILEPVVTTEVAEEPVAEPIVAVEPVTVVEQTPEPEVTFEIAEMVEEAPATAAADAVMVASSVIEAHPAPAAVEEEAIVTAEIEESAVEHEMVSQRIESEAPVVYALAAPAKYTPVLPSRKIEVPALPEAKGEIQNTGSAQESVEATETSTDSMDKPATNEPSIQVEVRQELPIAIVNEDRDVLFAFRKELSADEFEFASTSMDNNSAFPEDFLDESEMTFKIRMPRYATGFSGFAGHFRALPY